MRSKTTSLIISLIYLIGAYTLVGFEGVYSILPFLLLPLVCIWFGDELGRWSETLRMHQVTSESPGSIVRFMGWMLLIFFPIIRIIITLDILAAR